MDNVLPLLVITAVIMAAIGYVMGRTKGRENEGLALGFLLGPIGLVLTLLLPAKARTDARRCPFCREVVAPDATVCSHCQRDIAAGVQSVCPHCGEPFHVPQGRAGHAVRCPHCKKLTRAAA